MQATTKTATTIYTLSLGLNDQNGLALTETERSLAVQIVGQRFDAFTLIEARGYWRGKPEDTYRFEIIGRGADFEGSVYRLAHYLARKFSQECVLVTRQYLAPGGAIMVAADGSQGSI